jgi:hypothetical protein
MLLELIEVDDNGLVYQLGHFNVGVRAYTIYFTDTKLSGKECPEKYPNPSYDIKFDLKDNIDEDDFYKKPDDLLRNGEILELFRVVEAFIRLHYQETKAVYYFKAASAELDRVYTRIMTKKNRTFFDFLISKDGDEYEIKHR